MATTEQDLPEQTEGSALNWGPDAPRGGKAVMSRILKENATVPLFFGQTMIQSLRDVGYNHTTSALCEHIVLLKGGRVLANGPTKDTLTADNIRRLYDVDADVQFHQRAGHLTVVPIARAR